MYLATREGTTRIYRSRPAPKLLAVLVALFLVAAACGDDDSTTATPEPDPVEPADEPADEPVAHNCPEKIVIQLDWFPQADPGGVYNLIGPNGDQDASNGKYTGPLQAKYAEPYGDNVPIIEIRDGGSLANNPAAEMYIDDSITFIQFQTDLAVQFSKQFPTLSVVTTLDGHPAVFMWDPLEYPGATTIADVSDAGATFLVFDGQSAWLRYLVATDQIEADQIDPSYFGGPDRFIAEDGVAQIGFVTDEIYKYEHEFEEYGRDIAFQLVGDTGFEWYPGSGQLLIRPEDQSELDSCLKLFVPTVQQSAIDYMTTDFGPVNTSLIKLVEDMASFWTMTEAGSQDAIKQYLEHGLFSNGSDGDDTFGNWDMARVQRVIDILLPILTADGLDTFDPDLTADGLVTNEYIDPNISFQG